MLAAGPESARALLIPAKPRLGTKLEGTLTCVGHDVDLRSWETFLQFVEWVPRPLSLLSAIYWKAVLLPCAGGRSSSLPLLPSRTSTQAETLPKVFS